MTQNHCAFCDICPIKQAGATIEHFRPTSKFPLLACTWTNLFYCCHACNEQKGEEFEETLLKPDEEGYSFDYFFVINFSSYKLEPNPQRSEAEQKRAKDTIRLYGLNDLDRPEDRESVLARYLDSNNPDKDRFPYRYLF